MQVVLLKLVEQEMEAVFSHLIIAPFYLVDLLSVVN